MKIKIGNLILSILPFLFVFFASLYNPIDPDLGWHLKYGEYFFQNQQVLKENIFSVEMPNYQWVNHSWFSDLVTYGIFKNFGFLGLSVSAAIIVALTFYFFSKASKMSFWENALTFPFLVILLSPINSVSFRPQLFSLLFLGILFFFLKKYEENRSNLSFLIVFLFFLWANIHGQFILGLGVIAIWSFFYFVKQLTLDRMSILNLIKLEKNLFIIFSLSVLAVLANPFGIGVYEEALKHFGNPLSKYIAEWKPFDELSVYWAGLLATGVVGFLGILFGTVSGRLKTNIGDWGTFSLLYAITFNLRRFAWPAYYFSFPLFKEVAIFLRPEKRKIQEIAGIIILSVAFLMLFAFSNPILRVSGLSWDKYCERNSCSPKAMEFLKNYEPKGNLMTFYDWGGWIIWNYPEIKPTIDGRMVFWRDENGYSGFLKYYRVEQNIDDIEKSQYDLVLMSPNKPVYQHLEKLAETERWKIIFEDEVSGIFQRVKAD